MKVKNALYALVLFVITSSFSQNISHSSLLIPASLKQHANAVIRNQQTEIILKSSNEMEVSDKRIITVLNKEGDKNVDAYLHYDSNVKIKDLEVLVYNQIGAVIKKIKKNDFKDVSAVDGGTLYSDSRVKVLEYTPISYPYTIEFNYVINTSNTAFIRSFMPVYDFFVSVQNSSYAISFPADLSIRTKEKNFENIDFTKEELPNKISFSVKNIEAYKPEQFSPSIIDIIPKVLVSSNKFSLEGVQSQAENWEQFGKWIYNDLLKDTHDLPASTINTIQELVKDETNDIEKAKKIYQYVQDKVRYISVQVGIGGWKPFKASEVDKLGYGDCKALTNYTMSLLNAVGIKSNYTVIYAESSQRNIDYEFASMQGNHVILNIPSDNDESIWLECTNQKLPFGFIGDFTDDRDALVITPEGGKIQHTKKYTTNENLQIIKGTYNVSNEGDIDVVVNVNSKGIQYDDKYWLETETQRDLDSYYKKRWKYINGININTMRINNDKNAIEFIEDINFQATSYTKKAGDRMLLTINALNRSLDIPDKYKDRKLPLKIKRGFKDIDEVEIKLPSDFKVETAPKNVLIENKFGSYKAELETIDENTLVYKREFIVNDGEFPKEDYDAFRDFYKDVSIQDNSKIALINK
ncbi:DUF3857 domain-containing transglutaminase family protein [Mariniflexile aquimaris]|uniref:DUF3857 domain-containing transglutaminase family protein n=1 Tax=Mariniflexile aquimaris TaxID=881009 RepID=A0ABW3BRL7_9FLAO